MISERGTIADYLVRRLEEIGLRHVFGVPGDFVLRFMDYLVDSTNIELVTTCNELNAGYAADAYGKLNGVSAVCVTYNVGGLSSLNAVVGAASESVPLIVISGAPPRQAHDQPLIIHHTNGNLNLQSEIYRQFCAHVAVLDDPQTAAASIDKALQVCLDKKQPVYIEIPTNMVDQQITLSTKTEPLRKKVVFTPYEIDKAQQLAAKIHASLTKARSPIILVGADVPRFGLAEQLRQLLSSSGLSYVTTMGAKAVLEENHPNFVGTYAGVLFCSCAQKHLESSDFVLNLGAQYNDMDMTSKKHRNFHGAAITGDLAVFESGPIAAVKLCAVIESLTSLFAADNAKTTNRPQFLALDHSDSCSFWDSAPTDYIGARCLKADATQHVNGNEGLRISTLFYAIGHLVSADTIMVADIGEALFSAVEIPILKSGNFVSQPLYLSIGYSIPATLAAGLLTKERGRTITVVGDGALQMTCQELSTIARHKLNPIIIVINNNGYAIERVIHDGPYNDLQPWQYDKLPLCFSANYMTAKVRTPNELVAALEQAHSHTEGPVLIEAVIDASSVSQPLKNIGASLGLKI